MRNPGQVTNFSVFSNKFLLPLVPQLENGKKKAGFHWGGHQSFEQRSPISLTLNTPENGGRQVE